MNKDVDNQGSPVFPKIREEMIDRLSAQADQLKTPSPVSVDRQSRLGLLRRLAA